MTKFNAILMGVLALTQITILIPDVSAAPNNLLENGDFETGDIEYAATTNLTTLFTTKSNGDYERVFKYGDEFKIIAVIRNNGGGTGYIKP